jgi:hypothetical protein
VLQTTAKALAPEFARLNSSHQQDLFILENRFKKEERQLRVDFEVRLEEELKQIEIEGLNKLGLDILEVRPYLNS